MPETGTDRPVHVLLLVKGLGPGGAERLLVTQLRVSDHVGVRYSLAYVLSWKSHLADEARAAGAQVSHLRVSRTADLRWVWRLWRLLRRVRPDVVHSHSPLLAAVARLLLIAVPGRLPHVATEHNGWSSFGWATRRLNAWTALRDAHRFAVSQQVVDSMATVAARTTEVLVHGVELAALRRDEGARRRLRDEWGADAEEVVVGTVANYRTQKAWPTLLHAARQVLDEHPHVRFATVGQGPLADDVAALHEELGLGERFLLLGRRNDVPDVLSALDVFVLASDWEGLPVAVMEALAAGLPVVATAVGGVPEAVTSGVEGVLVQPADPAALAAALSDLAIDDVRRGRLARAALVRAHHFDARRAVLRQEQVYRALATRASSSA